MQLTLEPLLIKDHIRLHVGLLDRVFSLQGS